MCGITGAINLENHKEIASNALNKILYRGIDNKKIHSENNFTFAHCLHSIVGNKPQPLIKGNFIFGSNCEIYNWKELKEKYNLNSENDAELLFDLLIKKLNKPEELNSILKEVSGVFAFFLHNKKENYTILARDLLGEKPLWFYNKDSLIFASERKAIASKEIEPEELNPRKILLFNHKTNKLTFLHQDFFKIEPEKLNKENLKRLIKSSILQRVPNKHLGILFSGGLDSTLLAHILTNNNIPFTAYMTVSETKTKEIENAEKIAKELNFKLKLVKTNKEQIIKELPKIVNLIETADPVKVEVATTLYFSLQAAQKDNIKVIFSGVGADDIFGGYKRMHQSQNITLDSLSNLRRIYERDLYRDDVLSMAHNIELRLPYLDKKLVQACLNTPDEHKVSETPKKLMRELSRELGLSKELSQLKRNAAQYSSGIGKVISKIVKEKGQYKAEYFSNILKRKNIKLGALFSSGKDSVYALHIQHRLNYEVSCLITIDSQNKDSFMFHTPTIELAETQAECLDIPIILQKTKGEEEKELTDLEVALTRAKEKYQIQGIITGAIFSNYQRTRIEEICDKLNLKCYSPLWHMDQETEMKNLIQKDYKFIMTKVAAEGLDKSFLNKIVTQTELDKLVKLNKKLHINVAGEGGEFETLVLDAPLFKSKLKIEESEIIEEKDGSAPLIIKKISKQE